MGLLSKLSNVSWTTLQILLGGITVVGGTGIFWKNHYETNLFYKSKVVVEAIEVAKQNSDLRALLGEPINGGRVNFNDEKNFKKENEAHFEIPLTGRIHNAMMLIDAVKESDEWQLDKVNIQFKGKEKVIAQINIFKRNAIDNDVQSKPVNVVS